MDRKIIVQARNGNMEGMSDKNIGALGILSAEVVCDGTNKLRTNF